jgi:hypothetical protein
MHMKVPQTVCWKEAKVLQIEPNTTHRKYKESAHMSLVDHPISQPNLDIFLIWTPIISAEVRQLQLRPVQIMWESCVFKLVLCSDGLYSESTLIL